MKLNETYEYIVLCEDAQTKTFILTFLLQHNVPSGKIHFRNYPVGKGCGEQFVREEYSKEARLLSSRYKYKREVLVVCSDADSYSVKKKVKSLDDEVIRFNKEWDRKRFPILMWIPKREIETWIHYLRGENVDEQTSYRHSGNPERCKKEVVRFKEYCQDVIKIDEVPQSMIFAKGEYIRVCNMQY